MSIYILAQELKIAKIHYQLIFNILLSNFLTQFNRGAWGIFEFQNVIPFYNHFLNILQCSYTKLSEFFIGANYSSVALINQKSLKVKQIGHSFPRTRYYVNV